MRHTHGRHGLALVLAILLALAGLLLPHLGGEVALAAGCVVTTTNDSGAGSLRAALNGTDDFTGITCTAIAFGAGGTGTITLASDLPTVTRTVSVTGPGAASLTVNRNDTTSSGTAFPVGAGGNLTLSGLTVRGARMGVRVTSSTAVATIDSALIGSTSTTLAGNGVGVQVEGGSATLTNTILSKNFTGVNMVGGSATLTNSTMSAGNYGIYVDQGGQATLTNSTVSGNTGTGVRVFNGTATLTNATFSSNAFAGVDIFTGGTATVTGSTFSGNGTGMFVNSGGKATVTTSTFSGNGNGIHGLNSITLVSNSTFSGNTTTGVFLNSGGKATVTTSTFSGNAVGVNVSPGGSEATVDRSTLSGNGIGIQVLNSKATVTNSTLSGNVLGVELDGGGSTATVTNSTFSGNTTASLRFDSTNTVNLTNTLLAQRAGANCAFTSSGSSFTTITPNYSLADDATCFANGANGNVVVATGATGLAPAGLASNGGATPTIALTAGSPAVDAGNDATCAAAPVSGVDQRGVSRTVGAGPHCDIGAYEYVGPVAQAITFLGLSDKTYGDGSFVVGATGGPSMNPVTFTATPAAVCTATGTNGSTITIVGAGSCTVTANQAGSGDGYYSAAPPVAQPFNVAQAASTTTVTTPNVNYTGSPYAGASATVTGAGGLNQPVTPLSYSGRNGTSYGPSTTPPTLVGDYSASATFAGDPNHTASSGSATFSIANAAPAVAITAPTLGTVVAAPYTAPLTATFTDAGDPNAHTCTIGWDDGTPTILAVSGTTAGTCSATHQYTTAGVYTIQVTITDQAGAQGSASVMLVVYDPTAGFVTGGGWITSPAGAYRANQALTGQAAFGFVSKYQKGTSIPTGETEFDFQMAGFSFHSSTYQWLVVSGAKAQFKGTGTVNGVGGYSFLLTATDGQVSGGGGVDKFRIKIWNTASGALVYDNNYTAPDDLDTANPQALGGGSIVIHK